MSNTKLVIVFLIGFFVSISVNPVFAHGFGERYDLPVPLEMYLFGAGLAIILSFFLMGIFFAGTYLHTAILSSMYFV